MRGKPCNTCPEHVAPGKKTIMRGRVTTSHIHYCKEGERPITKYATDERPDWCPRKPDGVLLKSDAGNRTTREQRAAGGG